MSAETVREEYRARLDARRAESDRLERLESRLSVARLGLFVLAVLVLVLAAGPKVIAPDWLLLPVTAFVVVVVLHLRIARRRDRARRSAAFYERARDRLDDRWPGQGNPGQRFRDDAHPYARDLDLFGRGSLFELLCSARTRAGEDALAAMLSAPAEPGTARARQHSIRELAPRLDLREDLAVLGEEVRVALHGEDLARWGEEPARLAGRAGAIVALVLAVLGVAAGVLWATTDLGARPLAIVAVLDVILLLTYRGRIQRVLDDAERPAVELDLLAKLLERVEAEPFTSDLLVRRREELATDGTAPSVRIAKLRRLVRMLDARRNQLFAFVAALLLWGTQLAFAIERWRARSGRDVARWLAALGEIEALLSLASHAHERPDDPFPEITDDEARYEGRDLGHPLLPDSDCIRNDVVFEGDLRLFLVSGSNMSGKSTLLRTVGTNAVLALAGAPVRARSLRIGKLQVAASTRVQDSLLDGRSRFYAEIERLKQVVDLAGGDPPALFLLDELLHGTNSHDRAVGAEAVVRELVERGAMGLVTTHDLTLAGIADALGEQAVNVHFEDHIEDERMVFDYRLRPGVVTKSNALALMRSVGLDVRDT